MLEMCAWMCMVAYITLVRGEDGYKSITIENGFGLKEAGSGCRSACFACVDLIWGNVGRVFYNVDIREVPGMASTLRALPIGG